MNTLWTFLAAAAGPLAKRVLAALGIGIVSYAALSTGVDLLLTEARNAWGGITGDVAAYLALMGANQALALIAGGVVTRVAFASMKRLQVL